MKNKKTQIADFNKIPNHNLFVEYERQMNERFPEIHTWIERCRNVRSGKLLECLNFSIPVDDDYYDKFIMYADNEPKNGKIKCSLDFIGCETIQEEVDFEEFSDVRKMNIRNVILSACELLENYGSPDTAKLLEEKVKNG